jgi:bifunctional DNA-binding transcriptional regulator/antitoxin component of YhaV-PrlF toxin-antitoxin module
VQAGTETPDLDWPRADRCGGQITRCNVVYRDGCHVAAFDWLESKGNIPYVLAGGHAMSTLTVTAKGQVTLRKDLLEHLKVRPGEKIEVAKLPHGRIELKAPWAAGKISDVFDFLKRKNGPSLSINEINEVARRGWAGRR